MSNINQTTDRIAEDGGASIARAQGNLAPRRIPTDAEVRDAMRRARQMQARAIVGLFANLGK